MVKVIIMNTTLHDRSVPLPGNRAVLVKSNSSLTIQATPKVVKFLESMRMDGIRISVGTETPAGTNPEVDEKPSDLANHEPNVNEEPTPVEVEVTEEVDVVALVRSLDVEVLKDLVEKLGVRTTATSVNTLANKVLDAADDPTILGLLKEMKVI